MKKVLLLIALVPFALFSQSDYKVKILTADEIFGEAPYKSKVFIDTDNDGKKDITIKTDSKGQFYKKFKQNLKTMFWMLLKNIN